MIRAPTLRPSLLLFIVCVSLCAPVPSSAVVYECSGPDGGRILTDDSGPMEHCKPDTTEDVPKGPKSAIPRKPAAENPPPSDSRGSVAPRQPTLDPDASLSRPGPLSPADPEYGPPPQMVIPQTRTCAAGINRLNPFGSAPCQSRPGLPPVSVP